MKAIASLPSYFAAVLTALVCATGGFESAAQSFLLQPGTAGTKDTWMSEQDDFDHGGWNYLQANQDQFQQRIFIQFDLAGIAGPVTSAFLGLYRFDQYNADTLILNAHAVTQDWAQNNGWSAMPASSGTVAASAQASGTNAVWVEWDITTLVQDWMGGTRANYGVTIFAPDGGDGGYQRFVSSNDQAAAQFQPYIRGQLVPEPSAAALIALGLAALGIPQARRRAR